MWNWFVNHKTKIAGLIVVVIGALQTADHAKVLQELMGPNGYAIFNMIMGLIVTGLGFWNSAEIKKQGGDGFALISYLFYLVIAATGLLVILNAVTSLAAYP